VLGLLLLMKSKKLSHSLEKIHNFLHSRNLISMLVESGIWLGDSWGLEFLVPCIPSKSQILYKYCSSLRQGWPEVHQHLPAFHAGWMMCGQKTNFSLIFSSHPWFEICAWGWWSILYIHHSQILTSAGRLSSLQCQILVWTPCLMHRCVCIWWYILQNYNYKLHFQNLSIYHIPHVFIGTLAPENLDVCTACDPWDSNIQLTMVKDQNLDFCTACDPWDSNIQLTMVKDQSRQIFPKCHSC
jgi:hypothetical protein